MALILETGSWEQLIMAICRMCYAQQPDADAARACENKHRAAVAPTQRFYCATCGTPFALESAAFDCERKHLSATKPLFACDICKVCYETDGQALACSEAHGKTHEKVLLPRAKTEEKPIKHTVTFVGSQRLCFRCTAKLGECEVHTISEVQMTEPGCCDRCKRPIQDPPKPEVQIPKLSVQQQTAITRTRMDRRSAINLAALDVWKLHKRADGTGSGVEAVDNSVFKQVGPYTGSQGTGKGALPRTRSGGYIETIGDPVEL